MGSAEVWDERRRELFAARRSATPPAEAPAGQAALALPAGELAALVAGIVQATLDTRLALHEPARRAELARELEARLLALFADGAPAAPPREDPGAEPAESPSVAAERPGPATLADSASPAERALHAALEERLARLGGALAARSDLRARLVALALERLASAPACGSLSGEELRGLDVLQRRAAKLEQSLREARAALAYVSGLERVDTGIASIYRAVQGLALEDPLRERKRAALEGLFQANLALQKPG